MQSADLPENEVERLKSLFEYHVLDTAPEESFDQLTQLAASICTTPIALVSLIDESRQWFKSHHGLDATETPREFAFCAHAIHQSSIFEIEDSRKDERFFDNPLVTGEPHVIFYAGAPLKTEDGYNLGTLCVIDHKPGKLTPKQKEQLNIIAKQVVMLLELRKAHKIKEELFQKLAVEAEKTHKRNVELQAFSTRASHDIQGPLRQMGQLAGFCLEDIASGDLDEVTSNCHHIVERSKYLQRFVKDIFDLTRSEFSLHNDEKINFGKVMLHVLCNVELMMEEKKVEVTHDVSVDSKVFSQKVRIQQILNNLVSNGIKYSHPEREQRYVKVKITEENNNIVITTRDNGLGIPPEYQSRVFEMFERFHTETEPGSGLGMSIVAKHVEALKGSIHLTSSEQGTEFTVTLPILSPSASEE